MRAELQVLPEILLNPSMNFGDAHIHDQHLTSSMPANVSSSSVFQSTEKKTSTPNSACISEHGGADRPYRMCPLPSGHTHANGDPPVDTSSTGLGSPSGSPRSLGVVPSTPTAPTSSSTTAASPDPSAGEQLLDLSPEVDTATGSGEPHTESVVPESGAPPPVASHNPQDQWPTTRS